MAWMPSPDGIHAINRAASHKNDQSQYVEYRDRSSKSSFIHSFELLPLLGPKIHKYMDANFSYAYCQFATLAVHSQILSGKVPQAVSKDALCFRPKQHLKLQ